MKLLNYSFTKRHLFGLLVGLLAGGTANAQYTGIGTTTPAAGLHVTVPVNADTTTTTALPTDIENFNVLQVEEIRRTQQNEVGTYSTVMVYDPATGVVRRRDIDELFEGAGEWIVDGSGHLVPRNAAYNGDFALTGAALNIGVQTNITGATGITGATTVTGAFGVTGNSTFTGTVAVTSTSNLGGVVTLGDVQNHTTPILGTHEILFHSSTNTIEKATVADVLAGAGYWDEDSNVLTPSNADIEDEISIADGDVDITAVDIDFAGTNIDVTGAFGVTGNSDLTGTLDVSGATDLASTLDIGSTPAVAVADLLGTDVVMIKDLSAAPANQIRQITVAELMESSGYWDFDGTTLTPSNADLADDFILLDDDLTIDAATTITGNTDITGTFDVIGNSDLTGTLDVSGATDLASTLDIGDVQRVLATDLGGTDEVLIQQAGTDRVEYVTVQDLLSSNSEWVFDDANTDGTFDDTERVYLRRNGNDGAGSDDVFVTGIGNVVVDATKAYRFGDASTDQISATGITASAAYTMDFGASLAMNVTTNVVRTIGGSLTTTTGEDEDVSFTEDSESVPWLFYDSDIASSTEAGRVGINTGTPLATLHVAGNIIASNSTVSSDRRFKKDITELSGALASIKAMRGVSYDFRRNEFPKENFDDNTHIGFIAQELQEVLPQAVFARADGFLTVDYAAVTPVLVEAVQELSKQVEALQAENAALRSTSTKSVGAVSTKQLRELEARLADMDARLQEVAGRK